MSAPQDAPVPVLLETIQRLNKMLDDERRERLEERERLEMERQEERRIEEERYRRLEEMLEDIKKQTDRERSATRRKRESPSAELTKSKRANIGTNDEAEKEEDDYDMDDREDQWNGALVESMRLKEAAEEEIKKKKEAAQMERKKQLEERKKRVEAERMQSTDEKERHSPPILVHDLSTPRFRAAMKEMKVAATATVKPGGQTAVSCKYEDREKIIDWLKDNISFGSTTTPNDDRPGVSLVKGIDSREDPEFVKYVLGEAAGFPVEVRHFQRNQVDGRRLPWWIVNTDTRAKAMMLRDITHFEGGRIYWEALKNDGPIRCYNCQRWRHTSKNCLAATVCGLCAKGHSTESCTLKRPTKTTKPSGDYTCNNCNKRGHWTNYDGCPAKVKARETASRKETATKKTVSQRVPTKDDFTVVDRRGRPIYPKNNNNKTWEGQSFAEVTGESRGIDQRVNSGANIAGPTTLNDKQKEMVNFMCQMMVKFMSQWEA